MIIANKGIFWSFEPQRNKISLRHYSDEVLIVVQYNLYYPFRILMDLA